ncbi:hypothetical protein ACH436_05820 [Isoptericola sp. NPDC019693]|uniref:hypothetical protein n=1 Tax=Isoptericola sp. NPDC019693 TaxID=3364009 RepID=UPI0037A3691A
MTQQTGRRRLGAGGRVLAVVVAALLAGTGCVASGQQPGQATGAVADALAEAGSAGETARLAVELLDQGRITGPVADTTLLDQLHTLDDADFALTTLVPPDAASSDHRTAGLEAVGDVSDAVVAARAWVAARSGGDVAGAQDVPASAEELLSDLATALDTTDAALAEAGGP